MTRAALLGAGTGAALVCVAPPHGLYPLVFVAFIPLLRAADGRCGTTGAALAGWVAGAVFYLGVCDWLPPAIARLQGIDPATAWALFALFVAAHALQFALAAALTALLARPTFGAVARGHSGGEAGLRQFLRRHSVPPGQAQRPAPTRATRARALPVVAGLRACWPPGGRPGALGAPAGETPVLSPIEGPASTLYLDSAAAAAWVLFEWSFPKVLPWSVGAALGPDPLLRQGAELGGVYGLALLVVLINGLLATAIQWRAPRRQRLTAAMAAVVLLALALLYGAWRLPPPATAGAGVQIAIAQGGIAPGDSDVGAAAERAFAAYAALSRAAAPAADLLVWPESTLRVYLRDNDVFAARLGALVSETRRPLLLGALDRRDSTAGELNAAYLFLPGAPRPAAIYHKVALLPFGEFVPGAAMWPALRRWQTTGDFLPGAPPAPIEVDMPPARLRLAPSICFEAIVPGAFNELVRSGAALLVNLTDDGWFASEKAAAQHLELTRLRAVETRRWLVRASNSGISAFIDPAGGIAAVLPLGAVGALRHRVDVGGATTPYVRWGNWVLPLCAALIALPLLRGFGRLFAAGLIRISSSAAGLWSH